ncbi:MAG: PKD domain-containing protein [Candidatus Nanohaloarchaea archaeon]
MDFKLTTLAVLIVFFAGFAVAAAPTTDSITVNPSSPEPWDSVEVTVAGSDDGKILNAQLYWDGEWHTETCNTFGSCEKTFYITPTSEKTYTLKAKMQDAEFQESDILEKDMVVSSDDRPVVTDLQMPNNPDPWDRVSITVSAEDDEKVESTQVYWDGEWYTQSCDSMSCQNTAKFTPTQNREYTVKARAVDSGDQFSDTVEKTLKVGTGDTPRVTRFDVSDTTPEQGERFTVYVDIEDDSEVLNVQAYWDGEWYTKQCDGEKCEKQFKFTADSVGTHTLKVKGQDDSFETSAVKTKDITVEESTNEPPEMKWIDVESSPQVGEEVSITAKAGDDGKLLNLQFEVDGEEYTETCNTFNSCKRTVEFTPGHTGSYEVRVRAQDASFLQSDWSTKSFYVGGRDVDISNWGPSGDVDSPVELYLELNADSPGQYRCYWDDDSNVNRVSGKKLYRDGDRFSRTVSFSDGEKDLWYACFENGDRVDRVSASFTVNGEDHDPKADFEYTPTNPRVGETVQFESTSTDPDGDIVSYSWSFGDGETASGSPVEHSYESKGDYEVRLRVEDSHGNTDIYRETVNVRGEMPDCGLEVEDVTLEDRVIQQGGSTIAHLRLTNGGDPQRVKVEIRAGTDIVLQKEVVVEGDRTFSVEVSPQETQYINARVDIEGPPCGDDVVTRAEQLFVVGKTEENAVLNVHVEDTGGDPVEDALVSANGETAWTDSDGDSTLELEPGTYQVTVSRSGYIAQTKTVSLDAGEVQGVSFQLPVEEEGTHDLEITRLNYPESVCRGSSMAVEATVKNSGDFDSTVSLSGSGLGSSIQGPSFLLDEHEKVTRVIRFTNVQGSGTEQFTVKASGQDTDTVEGQVEVRNCAYPVGEATAITMKLVPDRALPGEPVKVKGFVDGASRRQEVTVKIDGQRKARISTDPTGYYQTYIRVPEVGMHSVSVTTGDVSTSGELEILPDASVNFVDVPEKVFEGETFQLCASVNSQITPDLVLLQDGEIIRTGSGKGRVCFDVKAEQGEHEYMVRALTYGRSDAATATVNVLSAGTETESFPDQIATVESGSGIVKVELYNNHDELRRYRLSLEGLPSTWVAQSEKTVVLDTGERKTVYFYLTPRESGSYSPTLSVKAQGDEIYREKLDLVAGGTTREKERLFARLAELFLGFQFY